MTNDEAQAILSALDRLAERREALEQRRALVGMCTALVEKTGECDVVAIDYFRELVLEMFKEPTP